MQAFHTNGGLQGSRGGGKNDSYEGRLCIFGSPGPCCTGHELQEVLVFV